MSVKAHYDNHLGSFYSWMIGDFYALKHEFKSFLGENKLSPVYSKVAIDLGAGQLLQGFFYQIYRLVFREK